MNQYIDIGVNLTGSAFSNDLDEVLLRAQDASVNQLIITGTDILHSQKAIELCQQHKDVLYSTVGVHPHHADDFDAGTKQLLRELSENSSVVAIGECGLDFNRNYSISTNQIYAFEQQVELACELKKPLFLHQRDAHDDFVSIIKNVLPKMSGAVAHCFTGTAAEAIEYVDMGLYIGITGWICDERRGADLQEAVKHIPLDRIMLETDAPYLLPRDLDVKPVHSRRNEPCFLPHICRVTARYMEIDEIELAEAAAKNSKDFFNI